MLSEVAEFLHALEADPSTRDRALLLVERTRLLAERGAAAAQRSDELRADATRLRTGDDVPSLDAASRMMQHELATPITMAQTALELLAADDDPASKDRFTDLALRSLRLASRLLETWGRVQDLRSGPADVELSWSRLDLSALVRECVADVDALRFDRHEYSVDVERAVTLPADPDAVRQILFNLLTNAAKFSPDGSRIEVRVTATAEHAVVAVRDRGPGLSPRDADRIFEAGQRLDPSAPGMGLGLFVARQLVRAHGGDVHVEESPGEGSRFIVRLPLSGADWQRSLERREAAAAAHEVSKRERDTVADDRDAELDQRELVADERDAALDSRETLAHERDARLDRREER